MSTKVKFAIQAIDPSAKFRILDDSIDKIEWLEDTTPIAREVISAKITEQENAYNNDYARKRREAYPSMWDQLDMIYWDQVNGTTKFKEAIAKVKTNIPKK